jgi:hypothetical protein
MREISKTLCQYKTQRWPRVGAKVPADEDGEHR